jgi:hypothetical protein
LYRYIDFSNSLLNNDLRFKFKKINIDNLDCNFINLKRIRIVFENIFDQSILSKFFILSLKLDGFFRKNFLNLDTIRLFRLFLDIKTYALVSKFIFSLNGSNISKSYNYYTELGYYFYLKNSLFFGDFLRFSKSDFFYKNSKIDSYFYLSTFFKNSTTITIFLNYLNSKHEFSYILKNKIYIFYILNNILFLKVSGFLSKKIFFEKILKFALLGEKKLILIYITLT